MPALSRPAVNPRWQFHAFWLVLLPLPPLGVSAGTVQWLVLGGQQPSESHWTSPACALTPLVPPWACCCSHFRLAHQQQ